MIQVTQLEDEGLFGRNRDGAGAGIGQASESGPDALAPSPALLYQRLVEAAPFGCALCEVLTRADGAAADGRFVMVNAAFERATGFSAATLSSHSLGVLLPLLSLPTLRPLEAVARVARTGKPEVGEYYSTARRRNYQLQCYSPGFGLVALVLHDCPVTPQPPTSSSM